MNNVKSIRAAVKKRTEVSGKNVNSLRAAVKKRTAVSGKNVNSLRAAVKKRFPMNLLWKGLKLDNQIVIIFLLNSEV